MPLDFDGQRVRVVMVKGEPWWYATDVCKVLGIGNAPQAVSYLDDDERTTITTNDSGQTRNFMLVNESGLYSLIFRSRKPEAKRFKKWVTSEVLPTIRKTGSYQMGRIAKTAKRLKSNIPTATALPHSTPPELGGPNSFASRCGVVEDGGIAELGQQTSNSGDQTWSG